MKRSIATACALVLCTTGVYAQSSTKKLHGDTTSYKLEEITVTATRQEEAIIKVPLAVSIIPLKQLQNTRGYGLDEVLGIVPGVLAQSRTGNQDIRLTIRGYGARGAGDRSNSGTSRGVRILLDGIPETEPDGRTAFDHIDLSLASRMEVVRSNASSLYGNATGGILNISTIPQHGSSFVSAETMMGSFGFRKVAVQAGGIIGSGMLYAGATNSDFDGWRDHSRSHRFLFNVGILSNLDAATTLEVHAVGASNFFNISGPLTQAEFDAKPEQGNATYLKRDEHRFNRIGRIGVTLQHNVDENTSVSGMLFVNPKYLQRSERGTFRDFTRYHLGGNLMARKTLHFDGWNNTVMVGMDEAYQDGAILFYNLTATNGRSDTLRSNKREGANNFGVFIHDEVAIGNSVRVFLGARYDKATYYSQDYMAASFGLQDREFEYVTPKVGFSYLFSPHHSVYANMGGGIEIPAGNETDPAGTYGQDTVYLLNPLLDPITSTTYEVGTKQLITMEDSPLQSVGYDVAAYYINIKNDIIPYRGGRFYFTAGETRRMGVEVGASAAFTGGLSLQAAFTYSNNTYVEYKVDSAHYNKPNVFANYADNKSAGIPDMYGSLVVRYEMPFISPLYAEAGIQHVGKYFADDANTYTVPSYTTMRASIGLSEPVVLVGGLAARAALSVTNLTDAKYAASAFINPDLVNGVPVFLEPGLPRSVTFSVSLIYK